MTTRAASGPRVLREREFHRWLGRALPAGGSGLLPIGDDAAALRPLPGRVAIVTTDSLVEGTHFLPDSPPEQVGAAAVAVSLSDLAAKGATPDGVLLALLLPVGTPSQWAKSVVRGAERTASRFGAHVVGGDTKPARLRAVVGTALGWARPAALAPRSGARPGDLLVTTGPAGRGGAAAARFRLRGPHDRGALAALLDVRPRVREGIALAPHAHAVLDTSDGLADSTRLLARASHVRIVMPEEGIPVVREMRASHRAVAARRFLVLYGGDYELLAAVSPARWVAAATAVRAAGGRLLRIGRVERGHGAWLETGAGALVPMPQAGWQPFGVPPRRGKRGRSTARDGG
ncbi:MAG: thiamine-phosphate kinase [Thermoplasmata archaeon]